mmetsp:Transcript_147240/g.257220  ORF Transcript_147240/g.257220 Transcript_147240/m.257220 type:complete len:248 (+) Transcript_147240:1674-2417(+)
MYCAWVISPPSSLSPGLRRLISTWNRFLRWFTVFWRSRSSITTRRRSSSMVFICIRSMALWLAISASRSSMVICNWAFRFSMLNSSWPRLLSSRSSRLTCSFSTSWATINPSFCLVSFPSSAWQDSFSSVSSRMTLLSRSRSTVLWSTVILLWRASSRTRFTCRSSTLCCFVRSSSMVWSMLIFSFSSIFSSSVRSPLARLTFRSICCTWNSMLYSSSCCLKVSWSSLETLPSMFLFCACAPEISAR